MVTLTFENRPTPEWVLAFFRELDAKTYGAGFDILTTDAEAQLGVHRWSGREAIRESLRASNESVDSGHQVHEFWDGGSVKILRGEIAYTVRATGRCTTSVISHFLYMDEDDPTQVRRWIGAFGPLG